MAKTVGTRELKTRLGTYLRIVRSGRRLIVTDRGRPVAEIRPLEPEGGDLESRLRAMEARGQVTLPAGPMSKWKALRPFRPIRVRGRPVSETLLEDREDRV